MFKTPKCIAGMLVRISFGLSLVFVGVVHYMDVASFRVIASDGLGQLAPLGMLWAYIMPGLMIIGGVLLVIGMYMDIAAWAAGLALGSIPAGMLLKSITGGVSLSDTMPAAINGFIWLLVFLWVIKCASCCSKGMSMCGTGECGCGDGHKK
ncbi:hypothetical protein HZA45_00695 [Candidatus Peregrinibacteria bacterium]|nr:hypothetical protein [Candidatus Peregrinibacteria bacterium]